MSLGVFDDLWDNTAMTHQKQFPFNFDRHFNYYIFLKGKPPGKNEKYPTGIGGTMGSKLF